MVFPQIRIIFVYQTWGSPTLIDLTNLTRATRYRWYRVASFCPERWQKKGWEETRFRAGKGKGLKPRRERRRGWFRLGTGGGSRFGLSEIPAPTVRQAQDREDSDPGFRGIGPRVAGLRKQAPDRPQMPEAAAPQPGNSRGGRADNKTGSGETAPEATPPRDRTPHPKGPPKPQPEKPGMRLSRNRSGGKTPRGVRETHSRQKPAGRLRPRIGIFRSRFRLRIPHRRSPGQHHAATPQRVRVADRAQKRGVHPVCAQQDDRRTSAIVDFSQAQNFKKRHFENSRPQAVASEHGKSPNTVGKDRNFRMHKTCGCL